jgi:hypothetical protein
MRQTSPRSRRRRDIRATASPRSTLAMRRPCAHYLSAHQPDAVMNLAAESHVDRSIDGPTAFIETNIVGTFTLLQETLRYRRGLEEHRRAPFRLLHVSTDEVYGTLGADGLFTETSPYAPNSPYSRCNPHIASNSPLRPRMAPGSTSSRAPSPNSPAPSCVTSASHPNRNSRIASWPPWISSIRSQSFTPGSASSTARPDMIRTSETLV